MKIIEYHQGIRKEFTQLLISYFTEIDAQIPEEIICGKLLDMIEGFAAKKTIYISFAMEKDELVGFAIYQIDSPESDWCKRPGWGFIREFYVIPGKRKQGYGRKLASYAEGRIRQLGAERLYLTSDGALPFWLACGWSKTGILCSNGLPELEK